MSLRDRHNCCVDDGRPRWRDAAEEEDVDGGESESERRVGGVAGEEWGEEAACSSHTSNAERRRWGAEGGMSEGEDLALSMKFCPFDEPPSSTLEGVVEG